MPRKSWVDKAAESGDWNKHIAEATTALQKSGAKILASRAARDRPERSISTVGENEASEERDTSLDLIREHVDDDYIEDADLLPSDEQEKALAPVDRRSVVTLADAYRDYLERGGNRQLTKRVLAELGSLPVDQLDRSAIIEAGRKLYPKCLQSERAELVHDPLEEIVGFGRTIVRQAPSLRWDECGYWNKRKAEIDAKTEAQRKFLAELETKLRQCGDDPDAEEREHRFWAELDGREYLGLRHNWAGISKPPGPPPEPPEHGWRQPSPVVAKWGELWRHKHRGFLSALDRPDGRRLEFGPPQGKPVPPETYPITFLGYGANVTGVVAAEPYYGWEKQPVGRPREHTSNAEKQRAYRRRKKARETLMAHVADVVEGQMRELDARRRSSGLMENSK